MELAEDLSAEALREVLGDRPFRTYPALLSTDADARAWARGGADAGSVVVADYQASPRGRAGLEWEVRQRVDLCFSAVFRPRWTPEREGWIYSVSTTALSDVVGEGAQIGWPDEVRRDGELRGAVGAHVELGPEHVDWMIVSILIRDVPAPRGPALAGALSALEVRLGTAPDAVLEDHVARCATIGRSVRALLIPMGPGGPEVKGRALGTLIDGALLLETPKGNRVAVRPQNLGLLEDWSPSDDQDEDASSD